MLGDLWGNYSEEDLYQIAIARPLGEKIDSAIKLIQTYEGQALSLSPDGYYVAFSGGKDSIVMERLFRLAGVKFKAWYNNVTIDPPELVRFIKETYPHIGWNSRGKHLLADIQNHATGLPTRTCRWCCEIYKEQGGNGTFKAVGVRAEESKRRKGLWVQVKSGKNGAMLAPILYWTQKDVWNFITSYGLFYPGLYDQGFDRLGCVGCPLGGKKRYVEFERWPKYEEMWKKGGRAWWEKYREKLKPDGTFYFAHKFPTFESYWAWWMEEKNVNDTDEPDCQMWLW
jgi:phosphoadenosine phosphosulfate reductase